MAYPKRNVNRRADNITFTPIATFGKMANNDTMVVINVSGINYNDINDINEVSDGSFQFMAKATNNGRAVFLVIKAERIDDFFNKTDDIKNKFIELNHYNNDEIDTFFLRIKEIISQTPTAKDKEKNKENINKWKLK